MPKLIETSWRYRRLAVYASLVWSFAIVTYLAIAGADTSLARAIVDTIGWVIMFVLGAYVGGASWDDLNRMRHGRLPDVGAPPALPPPPIPPATMDRPPPGDERG